MSGLDPNSAVVEHMTMYKYLLVLEKQKKLTKYTFSYMNITRRAAGDKDGFDVAMDKKMKFVSHQSEKFKMHFKNVFATHAKCFEHVLGAPYLSVMFRFKFERALQVNKIQKPYIVYKLPITLEPGKPFCLTNSAES